MSIYPWGTGGCGAKGCAIAEGVDVRRMLCEGRENKLIDSREEEYKRKSEWF